MTTSRRTWIRCTSIMAVAVYGTVALLNVAVFALDTGWHILPAFALANIFALAAGKNLVQAIAGRELTLAGNVVGDEE